MAAYRVLCWRDIPSAVEASEAGDHATVPLSERFQTLIDAVAMRLGLAETEAYLEQWGHGEAGRRPGGAREVAETVAAELEARFAEFRDRGAGRG